MLESLETKYGESKIKAFIEFTVFILLYFPLQLNGRCKYMYSMVQLSFSAKYGDKKRKKNIT